MSRLEVWDAVFVKLRVTGRIICDYDIMGMENCREWAESAKVISD